MASPLRDIGILAHIDAGKTSLTERILFVSGRIRAAGDIDEGTTATDYLEVERERGITVKAAAAHLEWRSSNVPASEPSVRINLIDTPGHVDFSSEVGRSLRALDGAVVLVCGVAGVQSRTEALYRACARRGVARLAFVNKMDRRGASFARALADLRGILDPGAVAIQLPWGEGEGFRGVVDLVEMRAYDFASGRSEYLGSLSLPLPPELEAAAVEARAALVELLAEGDPELFEDFVAGRPSSPAKLRAALRAATIAGRATPLLCGSAFSEGAASLLLDAVVDYLPSPAEASRPAARPAASPIVSEKNPAEVDLVLGPGDPFSALVFKTSRDPHYGRLSWVRVRSGHVAAGDKVFDSASGKQLRILRLFSIQADKLEAAEEAGDGDIAALAFAGQEAAEGRGSSAPGSSGSTLSDPARPVRYEEIACGSPVVSLALEPRSSEDGERLRRGAAALAEEDPSLRLGEDPQTGRLELGGMGELHLEVAVERLRSDFGARLRVGEPRVAYRERLLSRAEGAEDFDRDLGGERARAQVALALGPSKEGGFSLSVAEALRLPPLLIAAVRRGAEAALSLGPSGFPLEGAAVLLEALALPGLSLSSPGKLGEKAAEIASSLAAAQALRAAGAVVVEPVMRLEISVPESFLGVVAAAVAGRGGRVESIDAAAEESRLVCGAAPLSRLFGFASELRSCTEGRAEYSARFLRYAAAPQSLAP
jgi:elongation factor G